MTDYAGQQLGNYQVLHLIGRGGFADVYLGEHLYLKVPVALKVLSSIVSNQEDTHGFLTEAQTVAHLAHPHIIRVTDFGVERNIPYLVMDYAPNGTLRQRHPRGTRVALPTIVSYVRQVAPALHYAHQERLIHRDVKPENMLLGRRDEVLLSDFGIALMTQSSRYSDAKEMMGTVPYMAPEQIQGKPHPASDQYALAVTVYEWLCGERLFQGSFTEIAMQHVLATPPALREKVPTLPAAVEEVISIALAKDPSKRFKSVTAFAEALEQASRRGVSSALASGADFSPVADLQKEATPVSLQVSAPGGPGSSSSPSPAAPSPPSEAPSMIQELQGTSLCAEGEPSESLAPTLAATRTAVEGSEKHSQVPADRQKRGAAELVGRIGIGRGQLVAIALGILLYGGVNFVIDVWYKTGSPLAITSLNVFGQSIDSGLALADIALFVPLVVAATSGPLAAFVTILAGQSLADAIAGYSAISDYYGVSWSWLVGRILIGLIAGLLVLLTQGRYTSARSLGLAFALSTVAIILGTAFTTYADIWIRGNTWSSFSILVLPALLAPFLLVLVLFASARVRKSRGMI
jgi:serine/threonine protein kinase